MYRWRSSSSGAERIDWFEVKTQYRARTAPAATVERPVALPLWARAAGVGAAGVAATLIAMQHKQIPPTINLEKPDPDCDLDYVPEIGRQVEIEHAICNCIAFGSKNSALVLRKV